MRGSAGRTERAGRLTVATYNVHRWLGSDRRHAPERAIREIRALQADVVGLQEVALLHGEDMGGDYAAHAPYPHDDEPEHTAALLSEATGLRVIPGPTMFWRTASYGNVLLTALPVLAVRHHDLSFPGREPRGAVDVDLRLRSGGVARVIVTHLGLSPAERTLQARHLRSLLDGKREACVVLMGDFNQWFPFWGSLKPLVRWFEAAPYRRTFPSWLPLFPLDRVWVQPGARLRGLRVVKTRAARIASDHLPVRAEIDGGA